MTRDCNVARRFPVRTGWRSHPIARYVRADGKDPLLAQCSGFEAGHTRLAAWPCLISAGRSLRVFFAQVLQHAAHTFTGSPARACEPSRAYPRSKGARGIGRVSTLARIASRAVATGHAFEFLLPHVGRLGVERARGGVGEAPASCRLFNDIEPTSSTFIVLQVRPGGRGPDPRARSRRRHARIGLGR